MKTMICLILDRSGSMRGREQDVIGGVNTFLDEQKKLPDPASIAMVRFDSEGVERFRPMLSLAEAQHIGVDDYVPRGGTPLLDAIGKTLVALDGDWKTEQPERAILVIVTDGQENESREYSKKQIKEMIESRQASGKWAIVYLAANVDAFAEAGSIGVAFANTAGFQSTAKGTKAMYGATSQSISHMRQTGHTMAHNLGRNIGEDDDQNAAAPAVPQAPQPAQAATWSAPAAAGPWTPPV